MYLYVGPTHCIYLQSNGDPSFPGLSFPGPSFPGPSCPGSSFPGLAWRLVKGL